MAAEALAPEPGMRKSARTEHVDFRAREEERCARPAVWEWAVAWVVQGGAGRISGRGAAAAAAALSTFCTRPPTHRSHPPLPCPAHPPCRRRQKENQEDLLQRVNQATLDMLSKGGGGGGGGAGQGRKVSDVVSYRSPGDMQHNSSLTVQVDHRSESVLVPIYGMLVPFHILTLKNASNNAVGGRAGAAGGGRRAGAGWAWVGPRLAALSAACGGGQAGFGVLPCCRSLPDRPPCCLASTHPPHRTSTCPLPAPQDGEHAYIRLNFNFGASYEPGAKHPAAACVKELSFRSADVRHAAKVVQEIKALRSSVLQRDKERAERATLVQQEKLVRGKVRRRARRAAGHSLLGAVLHAAAAARWLLRRLPACVTVSCAAAVLPLRPASPGGSLHYCPTRPCARPARPRARPCRAACTRCPTSGSGPPLAARGAR